MVISKVASIKTYCAVVLLILNSTPLIGCQANKSSGTAIKIESNRPSQPVNDSIYNVNFINQSNYARPGFVRSPFLAVHDELNIFILKSVSHFFQSVKMDESRELFYSGDTHIPFILKSGDTIYIKDQEGYDNNGIKYYSLFSKNEIRNNEITFFQEAVRNKLPLLYWEKANQINGLIEETSVANNLQALINIYDKTKKFSEDYFKANPVTDDFKNFIRDYVKFDHYIKIFLYIHKRNLIDSLIKAKYFKLNIDMSNIYSNCNYAWHGALYQYLLYKEKNTKLKDDAFIIDSIADANFDKHAASVVKYIYLKNNFNSLYVKNKANLAALIKQIKNPTYEKVLSDEIASLDYSVLNRNKIIDEYGISYKFSDIISRLKDSLIFIDFWASWCAPCRYEFSNYPALIKKIGTAKIKFVYVSIDQSKEAWLKAAKEEKLGTENSYLLVNPTNDLLKKMNLSTIPRYYLYDKYGKLISTDAPRPGDGELLVLFNKLLKED